MLLVLKLMLLVKTYLINPIYISFSHYALTLSVTCCAHAIFFARFFVPRVFVPYVRRFHYSCEHASTPSGIWGFVFRSLEDVKLRVPFFIFASFFKSFTFTFHKAS